MSLADETTFDPAAELKHQHRGRWVCPKCGEAVPWSYAANEPLTETTRETLLRACEKTHRCQGAAFGSVTFTVAELAAVKEIEADAVTDVYRDRERECWLDFVRNPTLDTRRDHFAALMSLLREIDARAAALLKGGA